MHLNLLARSVLCGLLALVFAPAAFSADNKPDNQDKKDLEAEIASRAVPMPSKAEPVSSDAHAMQNRASASR